jgi:membrane-associated phospholipid phosphatase
MTDVDDGSRQAPKTALRRVVFNTAPADLLVLLVSSYFLIRLWLAPDSPERTHAGLLYAGATAFFFVVWLTMRSGWLQARPGGSLAFRLILFSTIDVPFMFGFRHALAGLQPELLDAELIALDRLLFGEVPAVTLEPYVHPAVVEWLGFFYFSYFLLVAAATIPGVIKGRDAVRIERVYGILFIAVVGFVGYTLVPGKGPYAALTFATPLEGGVWWGITVEAVRMVGPQLDIFPSLHTAVPLFLALHTFANRRTRMLRWLVWPLVFVAANIIVATLYLRWHYAVDVIAGIALALLATAVARWLRNHEARRVAEGRQAAFGIPLGEHAGR